MRKQPNTTSTNTLQAPPIPVQFADGFDCPGA